MGVEDGSYESDILPVMAICNLVADVQVLHKAYLVLPPGWQWTYYKWCSCTCHVPLATNSTL